MATTASPAAVAPNGVPLGPGVSPNGDSGTAPNGTPIGPNVSPNGSPVASPVSTVTPSTSQVLTTTTSTTTTTTTTSTTTTTTLAPRQCESEADCQENAGCFADA